MTSTVNYFAFLPGTEPPLPREDLFAVLEARGFHVSNWKSPVPSGRIVVFEAGGTLCRATGGFLREIAYPCWVGGLLGTFEVEPSSDSLERDLAALSGPAGPWGVFRGKKLHVRVRADGESSFRRLAPKFERDVGRVLRDAWGATISFDDPETQVLGVLFRDAGTGRATLYLGEAIFTPTRAWRRERNSTRAKYRPFFRVGTMNPPISRVVFNLSRCPPGGTFLDPMCGSGGILLEGIRGARRVVGGDLDRAALSGAKENLLHHAARQRVHLVQASAFNPPFREGCLDAAGTDVPYGRGASTRGLEPEEVLERVVRVLASFLAENRFGVVTLPLGRLPTDFDPAERLPRDIRLKAQLKQRVHRTLTRLFLILEKTRVPRAPRTKT
ncbi:MAG: hypothetical protein ACTSU5_07280 [Promethearchaeota archaeon]